MGTGEQSTPMRRSKPASSNQETPAAPSYPDWSSSMQAYYGAGAAPPFFASTVSSPSPHPYLWGNQHPLMPPYGTPVPYPALYPPAGVYAHPNMAMVPGPLQALVETEAKASEGKDRTTNKKSKGASKAGESGKAASGSGNDGATQSAESGSEGSSDGSDENNNHEQSASKKGSFDQMLADGATAQNNNAVANFQASVPGNPVVSVPAPNLNIGMDLWNPSAAASGTMKMRSNPGVSSAVAPGMMGDQWIQDERELKRQKRKQSNRESARRSRLRKQAECEELQQRVESLNNENRALRDELQRLSEESEKLTSENNSIKEELTRLCGPEAVSKLESSSIAHLETHAAEENDS